MERLPQESPEVSEREHQQIVALLEMLHCTPDVPGEGSYFSFDARDYHQMPAALGYDAVVVYTHADGRIAVNVAHSPVDEQKQTDGYLYTPDDRSLLSQTIISTHNQTIATAHKRYDNLRAQAQEVTRATQEAYALLTNALRKSGEFETFFREYDNRKEIISAKRHTMDVDQEVNDELRLFLEAEELETEARLVIDTFDHVARRDAAFAMVTKHYRDALYHDQVLQSQIVQLQQWIEQNEETRIMPLGAGDPAELIYVLTRMAVLTGDSSTDE